MSSAWESRRGAEYIDSVPRTLRLIADLLDSIERRLESLDTHVEQLVADVQTAVEQQQK